MPNTATLLLKSKDIQTIARQMSQHFWEIESVSLTKEETKTFTDFTKRLVRTAYFMFAMVVVLMAEILMTPILLAEKVPLIETYVPPWMGYYQLILVQGYSSIFGKTFCSTCNLTIIMTVITLTRQQFMLLRKEVILTFSGNSEITADILAGRVKRIVEHHHFLLG